MSHPLDNPAWHALTSFHEHLAEVAGVARRYRRDVSPFCAVDVLDAEAWADLRRLGRTVSLSRADVVVPPDGWEQRMQTVGHQMVLERLAEVPEPEVVELGGDDVPEVLELIEATRPGPFLPRTIEMGRYLGVRRDGRLVAMAGERMHLPGFTEVSAVCTHPDARGQGLAAGLSSIVARGILDRGEQPVLHVAEGNPARRVYERLGFVERAEVRFSVFRPA